MEDKTPAAPELAFRFLGVGNARASELGSAAGVLEIGGHPSLLIDCGPRTLDDFQANYAIELPPAVFVTHLHMDHIGGIEQLFYRTYFTRRGQISLYVPADLIAGLHAKLANSPFILSEGGANFCWGATSGTATTASLVRSSLAIDRQHGIDRRHRGRQRPLGLR